LWVIRFVLAVIFLAHVGTAIRVTMENRKARPVGYYKYGTNVASYASRTMIMSGMLVLAFLVYHLLHFTVGVTNPEYHDFKDSLGRADVYKMFVTAFLNPAVLVSYIVSVFLLCFHLSHGLSSLFQTFGANSPKLDPKLKGGALLISVLIFIGYASVPLAVAAGVIK
ncbi:MAG TPA: succinate dehydrogenase cytochrome b subunit, partial [Leptospiraceae bacterium]|nr:succinate dehydrogenase cytochrome b subunit [Leptospiraceae bacterium]